MLTKFIKLNVENFFIVRITVFYNNNSLVIKKSISY
jgi:hypothetical protein